MSPHVIWRGHELFKLCYTAPFQGKKSFWFVNMFHMNTKLFTIVFIIPPPSNEPNRACLVPIILKLFFLTMLFILQQTSTASGVCQLETKWHKHSNLCWKLPVLGNNLMLETTFHPDWGVHYNVSRFDCIPNINVRNDRKWCVGKKSELQMTGVY